MHKSLKTAIALVIATGFCGFSAQAAVTSLDTVYVVGDRYNDSSVLPGGKADRKIHFGIYKDMDVMNVPANVSSYTEKTIAQNYLPARAMLNTLTTNPSVLVGGASTNNNVELQIRGMRYNTHDMLLEGIPGMMAMGIIPMNWVERVDVVTGPNVVLSGTGIQKSVSGHINFIPKTAKNTPNFSITETYATHNMKSHAFDWGQRFGNNNRYGVRINGVKYNGVTSFDHETLDGKGFYIHVDQKTKSSTTSLLMGMDHVINRGMPESVNIKANWGKGVTKLPDAKKSIENLMPDWSDLSHQRHVYTLSHEQKISDNLMLYAKGGYQSLTWPGYWDAKPTILNDAGDYTLNITSDWMSQWVRKGFTTGVIIDTNTANIHHKLHIGYELLSYCWSDEVCKKENRKSASLKGNMYTGIWEKFEQLAGNYGGPFAPASSVINQSLIFTDTISTLNNDLQFILGARHQTLHNYGYKDGKPTPGYKKSSTEPNLAIVYKITPHTSVYGNYSTGLTTINTPKTVENKDEIFPPAATKQYEIGIKHDMGNWITSISLFRVSQPDGLINDKNYYVLNGETRHQGMEWNITGKIADRLTLTGGVMFLDAKYIKTDHGLNEGNRVQGAPKMNIALSLDWDTPIHGLTINSRLLHCGDTFADSENKIKVPSWTRIDLGATYETSIADLPLTLGVNVYNLFNNIYWSSTTTKWGNGNVMLNPGRSYVFTASFHM